VDAGGEFWGSLYGERSGGMMQAADPAVVAKAVKPGEFNDLSVRCVGTRVTIKLNGVTTVDREFPGLPARGLVGLQLHGGAAMAAEFRTVEIKDLSADAKGAGGFVPLFNGKDLTGWKSVGKPVWAWADGRLVGTPAADKTPGFLLTEASFADCEVELEYKAGAGVGSGLFLRADANGPVSGAEQLEVQIMDDGFPAFQVTPYKTGSVFGAFARTADPKVTSGDWTALRVKLVGRKVEVWVNGTQTVDANLDDARAQFGKFPGLARPSGRIGLQQNQTADVQFRNLRVKRLDGTDPFPPKSVWVGTAAQTLTVTERAGDTFRGRFEVGATIVRDVSGTVKDGRVTWLAKDVTAVKGAAGGDNTGTLASDKDGDRLDVTWTAPGAAGGTFVLRRQKGQ
jgi:hypothetical protein